MERNREEERALSSRASSHDWISSAPRDARVTPSRGSPTEHTVVAVGLRKEGWPRLQNEGARSGGSGEGDGAWVAPPRREQKQHLGNWMVACGCQDTEDRVLFPATTSTLAQPTVLPPTPSPNCAGRSTGLGDRRVSRR